MTTAASKWLIPLALLFTLLNALKPLLVDDTAYYSYAQHIAEHPLDPYGFQILWYDSYLPANHVLAPPVLPYWWAIALHLFGDRPFLWKLWLFPFSLLFVTALYRLARLFTPRLEPAVVTMLVLSPIFLPSLNLMLDVPALSLSLFALTLFFESCQTHRWPLAFAAGIMAAVAIETKYTGFLAPAAMGLFAGVLAGLNPSRRLTNKKNVAAMLGLALVAVAATAALFVAWEALMAKRYGESHFLHELLQKDTDPWWKLEVLSLPLLALLGGTYPVAALWGLIALRSPKPRGGACPRNSAMPLVIPERKEKGERRTAMLPHGGAWQWIVSLGACLIVAGFAVAGGWGSDVLVEALPYPQLVNLAGNWTVSITIEQVVFTLMGAAVGLIVLGVLCRLLRVCRGGLWTPGSWRGHWREWFLFLWLGLEIGGYYAMTPFCAVRRIMGLAVVITLVLGRLVSLTARSPERRSLVHATAAASILLAAIYYAVDFRDAWASRQAAFEAAAFIRDRDPGATIWYVGHWGFQFYAENIGMRPVIPDSELPLRQGDWLVVPEERYNQQSLWLNPKRLKFQIEWSMNDPLPWRTMPCFYGTASGVPLEHQDGARLSVTVYRVTGDFLPVSLR